MADCTGNLDTLPLIILLRASTVNAREMNNAKISSVDLKHSKSVEIISQKSQKSSIKITTSLNSRTYTVKHKCPTNYGQDFTPNKIIVTKCWFPRRGENWRKTSCSRLDLENHYAQSTHEAESRNKLQALLVGGNCFHHCKNPAQLPWLLHYNCRGTWRKALSDF